MMILGIVLVIIGAGALCILTSGNPKGLTALIIVVLGMAFVLESVHKYNPQAIDVYRGNTTLQVTYQDSVAVDSVVIFKKK